MAGHDDIGPCIRTHALDPTSAACLVTSNAERKEGDNHKYFLDKNPVSLRILYNADTTTYL